MSTIMNNCGSTEYGYDKRIHMKGASEIVLSCCSHYLDQDGRKVELLDERKSKIETEIKDYANHALRTISLAYKDLK